MSTEIQAPWPAEVNERYVPLEKIGGGGMGVVWKARRREDGEVLAIKTIAPRMRRDLRARKRFLREATAVFRLRHPHIVRLVDFLESPSDGSMAMVMEYVEGHSLARHREEPMKWATLRVLSLQVLDALAFAHGLGVVHRDLKPENVLISADPLGEPMAKLVDFGIVHVADVDSADAGVRITGATRLGTPPYVAPELMLRPELITPSSDLHSFGVLLYEMLTGSLPWKGATPAELFHQKQHNPPAELVVRPEIEAPEGIGSVVAMCLSPVPLERAWFAADVRRALEALPAVVGGAVESASSRPRIRVMHPGGVIGDGIEADTEEFSLVERAVRGDEVSALHSGAVRLGPGAGAFVREPAFVGRAEERAVLRRLVTEVLENREPRVLLVHGPSGVGKSRLLHWLRSQLLYDGLMLPMVVDMSGGDMDEAVRRAVLPVLGCTSWPGEQDREWLVSALTSLGFVEGRQMEGLLQLLLRDRAETPVSEPSRDAARWRRYGVILQRIAERRPLCLLLEGVQSSGACAAARLLAWFSEEFLPTGSPVLAMAAVTVDSPLGAEGCRQAMGESDRRLRRALDTAPGGYPPRVERLSVMPLSEEVLCELLASVGTPRSVASEIAACSAGLPAAAIELLWTFGSVLPAGMRAIPNAELFADAMRRRLELASDSSERLEDLQFVLSGLAHGPEVMQLDELQELFSAASPSLSSARLMACLRILVSERILVERRVGTPGLGFRTLLWRSVLRRRLDQTGSWPGWSRHWERVLASRKSTAGRLLVRADHLMRMGEPESAALTLVEVGRALLCEGDLSRAEDCYRGVRAIASGIHRAGTASRLHVEAHAGLLKVALAEGRFDAPALLGGIEQVEDPQAMVRLALVQAEVEGASGESALARRRLREAVGFARRDHLHVLEAECLELVGRVECRSGRLNEAESCLVRALEVLPVRGSGSLVARLRMALAETFVHAHRLEDAEEQLLAAERWYQRSGDVDEVARRALIRGYLGLRSGAVDRADRFLDAALVSMRFRTDATLLAEIALASAEVALARGAWSDAARHIQRVPNSVGDRAGHPLSDWLVVQRAEIAVALGVPEEENGAQEVLDAPRAGALFPPLAVALARLGRQVETARAGDGTTGERG